MTKIYTVLWKDKHASDEIYLFNKYILALKFINKMIIDFDLNRFNDLTRIDVKDYLYYCIYGENNSFRIEEKTLMKELPFMSLNNE